MKRVTVTVTDELERDLNAYLSEQDTPPSLTTVMQVALRDFLRAQRLLEREYRPARGPLQITPAEKGSGKSDVSVNHDKYFAE